MPYAAYIPGGLIVHIYIYIYAHPAASRIARLCACVIYICIYRAVKCGRNHVLGFTHRVGWRNFGSCFWAAYSNMPPRQLAIAVCQETTSYSYTTRRTPNNNSLYQQAYTQHTHTLAHSQTYQKQLRPKTYMLRGGIEGISLARVVVVAGSVVYIYI